MKQRASKICSKMFIGVCTFTEVCVPVLLQGFIQDFSFGGGGRGRGHPSYVGRGKSRRGRRSYNTLKT